MLKRILAVLILFLSYMLPLSACRPTPAEKAVAQKEDIISVLTTPGPSAPPYAAPDYWREENAVTISDLTVHVDAPVTVPASGALPVAAVKGVDIDEAMTARILDVLFDGQPIYTGDGIKTKRDIEQEILEERETIALINAMERNEPRYQEKVELHLSKIEKLTRQLADAPEEHARIIAEYRKIENHLMLVGCPDIENHDAPHIRIIKDDGNLCNTITYFWLNDNESIHLHVRTYENIRYNDEKSLDNLRGVTMTQDEARSIADDLVSRIGAGDLQLSAVNSTIIENFMAYDVYYKCPQCYVFRYTRHINGVPVTFDNTDAAAGPYSPTWGYETASVCVDDRGVVGFEWTSPCVVTEIVAESAELLPFDEIQRIFKSRFAACHAYDELDPKLTARRIVIDEIILGLMRIAWKDHPGETLLIPVWDFYGTVTLIYNDDSETDLRLDENNEFTYRHYRVSYLTINAIDGTVIDRKAGY